MVIDPEEELGGVMLLDDCCIGGSLCSPDPAIMPVKPGMLEIFGRATDPP